MAVSTEQLRLPLPPGWRPTGAPGHGVGRAMRVGPMGAAESSPVEGEGQHPDVLVGGQAEEDAPQAGICNPRVQCPQGPLVCLWEPGSWTPT